MQKCFLLTVYIFISFFAIAQIDTAKIRTDTTIISNKQREFSRFAQELIDSSLYKKQADSLTIEKSNLEKKLAELNRDKQKNQAAIFEGNSILTSLKDRINSRKKLLSDFEKKISEANIDYDSLKNSIIKLQENSDSISKQAKQIQNQSEIIAKKTDSAQSELNRILSEISKKEDSLEAIASIKLKNRIIVYKLQKNSKIGIRSSDTLLIRKVHLYVKEGRIVEIIVKTNNGIFRNTSSQIDLVHFSERRYYDKLFRDDEDKSDTVRTFVYPGDAIIYEPIRSYGDIPYSEFDVTLTPDSSSNQYIIRENTSINTYFEVAAFTDIKGIAGDANGLAQITGSAKFITSTRNRKNTPLMGLHYVAFNGGLSKFDNDFKGTFINEKDSVNRKDLFQRAQYSVGVKVNLLHWVRSPYPNLLLQDIQINTGFNFMGSRIADTLMKVNDTLFRTVTQNQFFIEPTISFARQKNFSMSIGFSFFYQNLKASANIINSNWEWWWCPTINLMYYSKRDSKNKIFFRYNHFSNLNNKKQAYYQLQLGFAANLTNVIQGK